ncbi:ParB/RepB/Spo0J family partition protein [Marinibaculum pumilum]|uniref:ParB/RepB/Spo0J family partition protein n=1 Tax=Marinibaculum pumilum TaxID=1766165 RepID=A0ABV7L6W1_9PROT
MATATKTKAIKAATRATPRPSKARKRSAKAEAAPKAEAAGQGTPAAAAELREIPLAKLVPSEANVRRTRGDDIQGLAASIEALGLLSSLTVASVGEAGTFAVVAGERRRRALVLLAEQGRIPASFPVPCRIVDGGSATEVGLAENVHRVAMNPADQVEAWARLAEEGLGVAEIARRHGATERQVAGRLAPEILDALRAAEMSVEAAQAFALTDDHEAQKKAFEICGRASGGYYDPRQIRTVLTPGEILHTDKRARFVGAEVYRDAGGSIREDLFDEDRYFTDAGLLDRLTLEKLEGEAEKLRSEGWGEVQVSIERNYRIRPGLQILRPTESPLSEEDATEAARLESRIAELEDLPLDPETQDEDPIDDELQACQKRLGEIQGKRMVYTAEDKARAILFLCLDYDGKPDRGWPYAPWENEDAPEGTGSASPDNRPGPSKADVPSGPAYGNGLRDDLAALRRHMVRAEFLAHPEIAQDLLRFHMIRQAICEGSSATPFQVLARESSSRTCSSAGDMGRLAAFGEIEEAVSHLRMDWLDLLPDVPRAFEAFLDLSEADKVALMAHVAGLALHGGLSDNAGPHHHSLEIALHRMGSELARHWTPDATFFACLSKAHILDILSKTLGPAIAARHAGAKKAELVKVAARYFDDSLSAAERDMGDDAAERAAAWLPEPMRVSLPASV